MAGPGDPPEGNPEGSPGGGEDEYRSVVFDESFVRAARIQEFSARERLDGSARSVRTRRLWARGGAPRQALVLVLLIAVAFGTAVYLGIRNPYDPPAPPVAEPLRITLLPLAPTAAVAAVDRARPFAGQRAEHYRAGGDGYALPPARRTAHFSESQVMQALVSAKEYLVASSADPDALTGGDVRTVRTMLDPGQLDQFDHSLERPADDGRHAATGWLVRFDPGRIALADDEVRVRGTMTVAEAGEEALEVVTDHTLVYAVQSAAGGSGQASLFTVRRELRLRFDRADLRDKHVEVLQAAVEAGPLSCVGSPVAHFLPLLAGQRPPVQPGVDPHDHRHEISSVCGVLAPAPAAGPGISPPAAGPASPSAGAPRSQGPSPASR
ncbi:SCO2583 family membrane protein [Actinacidiphila glaucinigra]|uniref:SCO2583 family membrane protein n=1 Tax=Actinacidiphila glaucinigra TaxID=235986 RepID=UPI00366E36E5